MKRIIVFTACLSSLLMGYGQSLTEAGIIDAYNQYKFNNPKEFSFISTDRQIYFSGERIKLSAVIFDQYNLPTTLSKVCYLKLIHESGEYSTKYAFRLDSGLVNEQILLPTDVPTGNYQLIVYTKFMQNFDLNKHAHRIPIYIQNTLDGSKAVSKYIKYPEIETKINFQEKVDINLNHTSSKVFLEFANSSDVGNFFLVSEGFEGIQFVAKVQLKQGTTNIGVSREKFKGSFQKFILIDAEGNIAGLKCFYMESSEKTDGDSENAMLNDMEINGLKWVAIYENEPFNVKSQDLIKHIYRLFYMLPQTVIIDEMSFEKATSDVVLDSHSQYTVSEWEEILAAKQSPVFTYYPESNIQLKGKVERLNDLIDGASIIFHFFKNDLDVSVPLDESGEFIVDLVFPVGQDYVSFSVVENKSLKDISDKVTIEIEEDADFTYFRTVAFHDKSTTDDYINDQLELKYALSTFYNHEKFKTYFWEDYSFDMTFKAADYVRLENFEDFIKEAVMNVSVVENKGSKSVNVYNGFNGLFEKPQLIIHNNRAIRDESELFDLSFDQIDSVLVAFNAPTIRKFGNSFSKGILAVVSSSENYTESKERVNNFMPFTGYHHYEEKNPVSKRFESTHHFGINHSDPLNKVLSEKNGTIYIQSIGKDGSIKYYSTKMITE